MSLIEARILSQAVSQRLYTLRPLVQEYERELPDRAWKKFIAGIHILLDLVEAFHRGVTDKVARIYQSDPVARDDYLSFYSKVALRFLANLHQEILPFLQKGTQRAEYLLLPTIHRVVQGHDSAAQVVLLPDFDYNYGYLGLKEFVLDQIRKFQAEMDPDTVSKFVNRAEELGKWNIFLQYPISESDSALNLCVLSHELSHFFDHHEELYKKHLPQKLDEASFKALVDKRCRMTITASGQTTMESIFSRETIQNQTYKTCISMVEKWLREIIADVLAIRAMGPCYLFSLIEYLAHAAAENTPGSTHPAMAVRVKILVEELEQLGYLSAEGPLKEILMTMRDSAEAEASTTKHEEDASVAFETLKNDLPSIRSKLRDLTVSFAYPAERYQKEVPPIVSLLVKGVAPIETHDPVTDTCRPNSAVAILNAGWQIYKTDDTRFRAIFESALSECAVLANLNQLLLKAVEASEVVQRWPHNAHDA